LKLNLQEEFPELTDLLQRIGAREVSWLPEKVILPKEEFEIEVSPTSHPEITRYIFGNPKGVIAYDGKPLLLYLPKGSYFDGTNDLPKFHFMECQTIKDMREHNRFNRYIITNRTSGVFRMELTNGWYSKGGEVTEKRLNVCKNCLREYDYQNYKNARDREAIVRNFDIKSFFRECENNLFSSLPSRYDTNFIIDDYPKNWDEISLSYKNSVGWCCENCHAVLTEHRHLLNVHHRNGVKSDNSVANLQALCKICHAEQFMHQHLIVTPDERSIVEELRRRNQEALHILM
jgi:hypothetical protein